MMLSPVLLGLTLLIIVPALMTIPLAFTRYDALSSPEWLGLGNFREMLHDGMPFNALRASPPSPTRGEGKVEGSTGLSPSPIMGEG